MLLSGVSTWKGVHFMIKKIVSLLAASVLCISMASCGGGTDTTSSAGQTPTEPASVTLKVADPSGTVLAETTKENAAAMSGETALQPGSTVTATVTGTKYLWLEYFGLNRTMVYVPDGTYVFTVPETNPQRDYPSGTFTGAFTLTATAATAEEAKASRNLSANPYDLKANTAYPHATTNNEYNNGADPDFWVRNVIDGYTQNTAHGAYPYQSWGPERVDSVTCTVDFGRSVSVTEITVHVRADFPHDIEWASCDVVDQDGNLVKNLTFTHTADGQTFTLDAPATVSSLTFCNMVSKEAGTPEGSRKWVGFTEISVTGSDVF